MQEIRPGWKGLRVLGDLSLVLSYRGTFSHRGAERRRRGPHRALADKNRPAYRRAPDAGMLRAKAPLHGAGADPRGQRGALLGGAKSAYRGAGDGRSRGVTEVDSSA